MKHEHDENAQRAAELLGPLRGERPEWSPERREAVWQDILAAQSRKPRWTSWFLGLALATAAALVAGIWLSRPEAPTPAQHIAQQGPLTVGTSNLPSGAVVELAGQAELLEATRGRTSVALRAGRIHNQVPKLAPGERYHVQTALADVEVRGTTFAVEARPDGSTVVTVEHGEVFVSPRDGRAGYSVRGGESRTLRPAVALPEAPEPPDPLVEEVEALQTMAEGLSRRNRVLTLGRRLDRERPALAVTHWARATARYPSGAHAEEFAFRAALALKKAQRLDEARAAAARFRAAFPKSPWASETLDW